VYVGTCVARGQTPASFFQPPSSYGKVSVALSCVELISPPLFPLHGLPCRTVLCALPADNGQIGLRASETLNSMLLIGARLTVDLDSATQSRPSRKRRLLMEREPEAKPHNRVASRLQGPQAVASPRYLLLRYDA
jgi:hypothetical protein